MTIPRQASTPHVLDGGRVNQKQRTRQAIVDAAVALMDGGTAPTVAVNNRFREFFERSQVKPLLQELKATPAGWTEGEGQV